jgi:diaminohydroxyphosphoribosylaminopyrimidine deaminase/5-amino-6-(5-phosphoribosylamino)uracil reductase
VTPARDRDLLLAAVAESRRSPLSDSAYSVGAIVVDAAGRELARGHSRETDHHDHAEEVALARLARGPADGPGVGPFTLYSSLEPCTRRRSRPVACTELVLAAGIARVVIAAREPDLFADCDGVETLAHAGVEVVELGELAGLVRAANAHLPAWRQASRR